MNSIAPSRRVALVTGGSGGVCAGIALVLAERGWKIAITRRPGGMLSPLAECAVAAGAVPVTVDVAEPDAFARSLAALSEEFGTIDTAIHGVGPMEFGRFDVSSAASHDRMIAGNLTSAVVLAHGVLPAMRRTGFGRLIFFGMTGSSVTRPAVGLASYGAAKAGLVAFARTLALEEASHGITVNVVEPGDIRRKDLDRESAAFLEAKNPTGRAGSWEDLSDAIAFLVSPGASFVNGAVLAVGGGLINASE